MEETRANSGITVNLNQQDACAKYGENKEEVDAKSNLIELFTENESILFPLEEEMRQLREEKFSLIEELEICRTVEEQMSTMEEARTNGGKYTNTSTTLNQQDKCVKYGERKEEVVAESHSIEPHLRNEPVLLLLKEKIRQLRKENSSLRKDRKKYIKFEKQMQTVEETPLNSDKAVLGKQISGNLNLKYRFLKYGECKEEVDAESYPMKLYMRSLLEKEMRQIQQDNFSIRADVDKLKNLEGQIKIMKETLSLLHQDVNDMKKSSAVSRTRTLFAIFFCIAIFFARFSLSEGCP